MPLQMLVPLPCWTLRQWFAVSLGLVVLAAHHQSCVPLQRGLPCSTSPVLRASTTGTTTMVGKFATLGCRSCHDCSCCIHLSKFGPHSERAASLIVGSSAAP
eukprot:11939760-Karenia_brevis.AAC.1